MSNVLDKFLKHLTEDDESEPVELCAYCTHEPVDPKYAPYCSLQCSIHADNDNALDEQALGGDVSGAPEYKLGKSPISEKEFGFAFKGKKLKEGEPTGSEGSLYGGPTGSVGESETGMVGFKSFTEDTFADTTGMKVDDPRRIALVQAARDALAKDWGPKKPEPVKEAGVAPVYEGRTVGFTDLVTGKVKRPKVTKEAEAQFDPSKRKTVNGITYYLVYNAAGKPTWCTVPPREQDEDAGFVTAQAGLKEAIGNAPTRTGFFKKLTDEYPDIPVRYRNLNTKLCAESQDKATLHKIATFAHQNGLQTEMKKSPYDEWDSTWILNVFGFRS